METQPRRFMRVAAAFEKVARARRCDNSSGSDHSPDDPTDLSHLVDSFIENEGKLAEFPKDESTKKTARTEKKNRERNGFSDDDEDDDDSYEDAKDMLRSIVAGGEVDDDDEVSLRRRIINGVEFACGIVGENTEERDFKRKLMTQLRNRGLDSGLCKSKWERFGRNPAGKYEYIDIKCTGNNDRRYIIDLNLAGEFEIARPTTRYSSLLGLLPRVFVGKPEELKQVVRIMCNEVRLSMKRVGMHVPPWRRNGYMQAKWFGQYKRTVNEVISNSGRAGGLEALRRTVGFEELGETLAFWNCREELGKISGVRTGLLTAAFSEGGV